MRQSIPSNEPRTVLQTINFDIFYPVSYLMAAFPKYEDAQQVQRGLITGGYGPADCLLSKNEAVATAAQRTLTDHTGFLAHSGQSDEAVQIHLVAAKQSDSILLSGLRVQNKPGLKVISS